MAIYFDKQTLQILTAIYRSGDDGITWGRLQKRFGERADPYLFESLSREDYILTRDADGKIVDYAVERPFTVTPEFRSYILPRGSELLEERRFNYWRWVTPTLISISALIVSVISLVLEQ